MKTKKSNWILAFKTKQTTLTYLNKLKTKLNIKINNKEKNKIIKDFISLLSEHVIDIRV